MDIELLLDEIKVALIKVTSGGVTRSETENSDFKLRVYMVADVIRVDIKEKN